MRTVLQEVDRFIATTMPDDEGSTMRVYSMRAAFLAGFATALTKVHRLGGDDIPEEQGAELLERWMVEATRLLLSEAAAQLAVDGAKRRPPC